MRKFARREAAKETEDTIDVFKNTEILKEASFVHLHNHTQFSVLQSTIQVGGLVQAAAERKNASGGLDRYRKYDGCFSFCKCCFQS